MWVSTDKQADRGVSLEAQVEKIRAMATVHDVELLDVLVDAGESAKDLDRPGMVRILDMVQSRAVGMVIVAKLDRLTRSVKDLAVLLEQFQRRGVSLVSAAESLDTGSASGRLVLKAGSHATLAGQQENLLRPRRPGGTPVRAAPRRFESSIGGKACLGVISPCGVIVHWPETAQQ